MSEERNLYPLAFDGTRLLVDTRTEAWLGTLSAGVLSGPFRKVAAGPYLDAVFTPSSAALGWLISPKSDYTGQPAAGVIR